MANSMRNFLEADPELLSKQLYFKNEEELSRSATAQYRTVTPKPGFCLKTKTDKGEKVFINVCKGDTLPAPKEITDEELLKLLDSDDPAGFRIPMSLGEPHAELDKSGKGCTAYDVVINPTFFESVQNREILMGFFLTVVLEGLEGKYNIILDREWTILKNRKFIGTLAEQNVRAQSKPWIMEMDPPQSQQVQSAKRPLIAEVQSSETKKSFSHHSMIWTDDTTLNIARHKGINVKTYRDWDRFVFRGAEPPYTILQEPPQGYPDFLVADMHLPNVKTAASLTLDVGEDRLLLATRSNIYHLDVYLPYNLLQDECVAQFNRKTKMLTVTMPVKPLTRATSAV